MRGLGEGLDGACQGVQSLGLTLESVAMNQCRTRGRLDDGTPGSLNALMPWARDSKDLKTLTNRRGPADAGSGSGSAEQLMPRSRI